MHEMQTTATENRGVCLSVYLSSGSTRLHCAKTAERIKILFRVIPQQRRDGELRKILPLLDLLHISKIAESRDLKFVFCL